MGLWPFGRAKADVESGSRVVVLRARDGVPMRAKVTLRFEEPQTQATADELTEQCADLVRHVVREAPSANAVQGLETAVAAEVLARLPKGPVPIRGVEVAGLHIVGDRGNTARPPAPPNETPAWLSAVPTSAIASSDVRPIERGHDRPTPIQPVPSSASQPTAPQVSAPQVSAPQVSAPRASAPQASAPQARPPDPYASTAVSPSPFAQAAQPAASHAETPAVPVAAPHAGAAFAPAADLRADPPRQDDPPQGVFDHPARQTARPRDPFASTAVSAGIGAEEAPGASSQPPPAAAARPPSGRIRVPASVGPPSGSMSAGGGPRSSSGAMSAVDDPNASVRFGPSSAPISAGPVSRGSARPPPPSVAVRRRVVAARFPLPTGAGPYEVARGLTPLFRDTAGRILIAFLRTYDLAVVRRVPFDAVEGEFLSSLTAPSDGAPGAYAASHAAEIQRWRDAFGVATMERLQREANLAACALAFEGLAAEGVAQRTANAVVEGLAGAAFGDPDMIADLGRYLFPASESIAAETLANMIGVAGEGMPPGLETALEPLFASLREEVAAAALLAKDVMISV
jgi:hypothetical protein